MILESDEGFSFSDLQRLCLKILGKTHEYKIKKGIHPDVCILPKREKNSFGVDEVRFLIKDSLLRSFESENKVYIIKDLEKLTIQAQNAFLKILEEPPRNVYFIFFCKNSSCLLSTVTSRLYFFKKKDFESKIGFLVEDNLEKNKEYKEITEIKKAFIEKNEYEIMKLISKLSKNKEILKKKLIQLKFEIVKEYCKSDMLSICKKIEESLELLEKNVNLNLVIFRLI